MAAGGPQMLATSNVWGVDAAVRHVLWCFVLQGPLHTACAAPAVSVMPKPSQNTVSCLLRFGLVLLRVHLWKPCNLIVDTVFLAL